MSLDLILNILRGRKVFDDTTKTWSVYDSNGTELVNSSGILLQGLHGFLLRQFIPSDQTVTAGGGPARKQSVYVEKDGKIFVFKSSADAALWLEAQKAQEGTKKPSGAKKKRVPKPVQVINLAALKTSIKRIQTDYTIQDLDRFKDEEMFEYLLSLQAKLEQWQEDEDLIILLMSI